MCGHGRGRTGREGQMDLILMILAGTAAVLTVRAAAAREGFLRAAVNALLGLAAGVYTFMAMLFWWAERSPSWVQ